MKKTGKYFIVAAAFVSAFVLIGSGRSDFGVGKNLEILFNIVKSVNMYYVDSVDNDKMIERGAQAMLATLDPYTEYISKEEMDNFQTMTTGKYGGLGSAIRKPYGGNYVVFDEITEGYPVYKSGVSPGDSIIAVDGVDMKDAMPEKVSSAMKGAPGTTVVLKVKSIKDGSVRDHSLVRETIAISPISYAGMFNDTVAYIGFSNFSEGSGEMFRKEFIRLKKDHNPKGIIVDLRSNGGGIIDESIVLLSSFVPKNSLITSLKGRDNVSHREYYTKNDPIDTLMPLVVLINGQSASASEIVSGAVQDMDRGVIVGNRSVGKGLAQRPQDLGYGAMVKITIAKYYIPSGRCIQALDYSHRDKNGSATKVADRKEFSTKNGRKVLDGGGIEPDIEVKPEYLNLFSASIMARGYVSDYANNYVINNPILKDLRGFTVSEVDMAEFAKSVVGKPIEFTSVTESNLEKLITSAKREEYYDKIKAELEDIEQVVKARNVEKSLEENQAVLKEMVALEVMSRYRYAKGRVEYAILTDDYVLKAKEILSSPQEYKKLLNIK